MELKEQIYNRIKQDRSVSFAELARLEGFEGNLVFHVPQHPHLVLWIKVSEEAVQAIRELMSEKKIEIKPTAPLVYLADGIMLDLPVVKKHQKVFKKDTWLPIVFNPTNTSA